MNDNETPELETHRVSRHSTERGAHTEAGRLMCAGYEVSRVTYAPDSGFYVFTTTAPANY